MNDTLLIASVLLSAGIASWILSRAVAARSVHARQERLKEHLDWMNPAPRTSRKRGLSRR
jgi:hypothetical protein